MPNVNDIRGIFLPAPTPFDANGDVDESLFASMLDFYVNSGVDALFVLGSFGQGATLDSPQRMRAFEVAVAAVKDRIPVVPDVGMTDPYRSRELARHARDQGAVAIAMVAPYYYTDRTPVEVVKHFEMVESDVDLPLIIYNNPAYQGFSVTAPLMNQIRSAVPQLTGMVHGGDSWASVLGYQRVLGPDFKIFFPAVSLFPGMLIGLAGCLTPPLAFAPEAGVALVAAIDRGDLAEAVRLQIAVLRYLQAVGSLGQWFRPVQHEALRYIGFDVAQFPRWPTAELPDDARQAIHSAIDTLRAAAAKGSD